MAAFSQVDSLYATNSMREPVDEQLRTTALGIEDRRASNPCATSHHTALDRLAETQRPPPASSSPPTTAQISSRTRRFASSPRRFNAAKEAKAEDPSPTAPQDAPKLDVPKLDLGNLNAGPAKDAGSKEIPPLELPADLAGAEAPAAPSIPKLELPKMDQPAKEASGDKFQMPKFDFGAVKGDAAPKVDVAAPGKTAESAAEAVKAADGAATDATKSFMDMVNKMGGEERWRGGEVSALLLIAPALASGVK